MREPATSPIHIGVASLISLITELSPPFTQFSTKLTNILLDVLLGVIDTDIPVISVKVAETEDVKVFDLVVLTTCNTLPAGNAAAATPVQLVSTPLAGVPNAGEVKVGEVRVLFVSVSVVAFPIRVSVATGKVSVPEPATAGAAIVMLPEVSPATTIALKIVLLWDIYS